MPGDHREVQDADTLVAMKRWFWILDAVVVMSFAIIGSDFHGFIFDMGSVMRIAMPFLIALAVGIAALRAWRKPLSLVNGLLLPLITLVVGMALRGILWNEGTPRTFVLVTGAYFLSLMFGWRLIALAIAKYWPSKAQGSPA